MGTAIHKKVNSKGITAIIINKTYKLITFIVLLILKFDIMSTLLFSFFYIPVVMLGYFFALGVYKLFRPLFYFRRYFSPLILIGLVLIGVFGFNIFSYFYEFYDFFPYLFIGIQVIIFSTIIVSVIKSAKHRPLSMTHLFKERRRPFEYLYIGKIILVSGLFFLLMLLLVKTPDISNFIKIFNVNIYLLSGLNSNLLLFIFKLIFYLTPIIIPFLIIYNRHRSYDVGLKNYIVEKVKTKSKAIDYRYLNDRVIIESIDELIENEIIENRFVVNLNHCLKHDDVSLRRDCVITFRKIMEFDKDKIPIIVPYFMRTLKSDKIWTVRLEITESLSKIVGYIPNEIPVILDYLQKESKDTNRYVRWGVVRVYESIIYTEPERAEELIPKILDSFNDTEWSVRKGALDAIINIKQKIPEIIPKVLPNVMDLLKTAQDEDILNQIYEFMKDCTGIEVTLDNYQLVVQEVNGIVECMDEECRTQLYNNLKNIEDLKLKELEDIETKRKKVESFKDEKYKLSFD
jgi:hypothetical protein